MEASSTAEPARPGAWPWVGGLVVLALLLWGITRVLAGDGDEAAERAVPPAATPAAP
ncbi:MAG TPA: hypothetical protein VEW03_00765 [Longimicrobiaceae bacterium]|nr:hypothetical protein [Longimicrobiaceae bacterium]